MRNARVQRLRTVTSGNGVPVYFCLFLSTFRLTFLVSS